jgi:uncharacterized NAD(P)/FAD-binding protein YdhS
MEKYRIGIIGGGAAGTLVAIQLLKRLQQVSDRWVEITLFEKSASRYLRGIAYSSMTDDHILNVPSSNMSAFPENPGHFQKWLSITLGEEILSEPFVPRHYFGRYLEETLQSFLATVHDNVIFKPIVGDVQDVAHAGAEWIVSTGDGHEAAFDKVIFATGNLRPRQPGQLTERAAQHPRYFDNPWTLQSDQWPAHYSVLFIGTGLSMVDGIVPLARLGHKARLVAFSRKGLLPRPHGHSDIPFKFTADFFADPLSLRALIRKIRLAVRDHETRGGIWQDVIGALRPWTTLVWTQWPENTRRQFQRHLKSYWEVLRHRCPPEPLEYLQELRDAGQLSIRADRLRSIDHDGSRFLVRWNDRAGEEFFDVVVNSTGPINDFRGAGFAPFRTLLDAGELSADPMGLGLRVSDELRLIDKAGKDQSALFAIGSLTKGKFWESTAIPDIRVQAETLAKQLTIWVLAEARPTSLGLSPG